MTACVRQRQRDRRRRDCAQVVASSGHGLNIFPDAINDLGVIVGRGPAGAVVGSGGTFQNE